jgi:predicted MFS family arabinose efflux permease
LAAATLGFAAALGFIRLGFSLVLPSMQADLRLSSAQMGLIAGCSFAAYLTCSLPAGALATRLGTRRVVGGGLTLAALGLGLTSGASGIGSAIAAQVLAGGSAALVIVPVLAVSTAWFHPRSWGLATGVVVGGGGLGVVAAGIVIPALLALDSATGWRLAWLGMAAIVLGVAVVVLHLLREPSRRSERPPLLRSLHAVYGSPVVWQLGTVFFMYGLAYITYGTFFAAHLIVGRGLPADVVGRFWAIGGIAGMFGGILAGAAADRLGSKPTLALLFLLQGGSVLALAWGTGPGWYLASSLVYGLTVWSFAGVISAACGSAVGPALAPAGVSLAVVLMSIGQMLGPIIGGLLADPSGSFTRSLLVAAGADLLGLVGSLAIRPSGPAASLSPNSLP